MKLFFILLSTLLGTSSSFAYKIFTSHSEKIDYRKPTHLFLIGYSSDQADQFVVSSLGQEELYKNLYPTEQIVYLVADDPAHEKLSRFGLKLIENNSKELLGEDVLKFADKFSKIKSFDVYSHSSIHGGIGLVKGQFWKNLAHFNKKLERLADNFTPDAYATLNGCNTGFRLAPILSEKWRIPVRGSFTSTDFQELHSNGSWYFNNPGSYPAGGFKKINDQSFATPQPCSLGKCKRMRADNVVYNGVYGDYSSAGGLGFAKFFCNFPGGESKCPPIMAKALLAEPGLKFLGSKPTLQAFKEALVDYLCPIDSKNLIRETCKQALLRADADPSFNNYSPYRGNNLICDFKGCNVKITCSLDNSGLEIPGSCKPKAPSRDSSEVLIREYRAYVAGFEG